MRGRRTREPDEDDDAEEGPSKGRRPRAGRHRPHAAVREWAPDEGSDEGFEEGGARRDRRFHREKERVYFRARDSLYFEPLVALMVIVLLLVSLYAYTSNWPPVYVVESESMQHGTTDILGLINTGDLVLAQRLPGSQVQTYVDGESSGYTTYGEYGDVLLYHPNGLSGTPVIHRAIVFLEANANGTWDIPSLSGLTCGPSPTAAYSVSSSPTGCGTVGVHGVLTLRQVGWRSADVTISLDSMGRASGFVTMGDNNYVSGTPATGISDQASGISGLVQPSWMVGVARGSVPWVGSLKLLLEGNAQEVPPQSWEYLGLSLAALVLIAMGLHYVLRAEGVEDPRRLAEEEEEDEGEEPEEDSGEAPTGRRWLHPLRAWGAEEEGEEDEPEPARSRRDRSSRRGGATSLRGRPSPKIGRHPARSHRSSRREASEDEDE